MSRVTAFYEPAYAPGHSPLLARLGVGAALLDRLGLVDLVAPPPLPAEALSGLHAPDYLDAFLQGREPMASSQGIAWAPAVRDATLAMLAGQLAGARHALRHGIAMNLARGFHHAVYERGSGYCALNGLALVAHRFPDKRVFVIDCDEHGGNGTEEFAARMPNLFTASIFGTRFGCYGGVRSWAYKVNVARRGFAEYLFVLGQVRALLAEVRPDLVIYQAGADCHRDDPKSQAGLSTAELFFRDLAVFAMVRDLGIPVLFVLAGGYQKAEKVARLNANTVRAARRVYRELLLRQATFPAEAIAHETPERAVPPLRAGTRPSPWARFADDGH